MQPSSSTLRAQLPNSALAFRGYNVTNLGRSRELLFDPEYGPTVRRYLERASAVCSETTGRPVNLVDRVEQLRETQLEDYAESIALILAMEHAQLEILRDRFDIDYHRARISVGFSLGEISALVAGGVYTLENAAKVPLALADDCVALAHDTVMGIVFSKGDAIPMDNVTRLLLDINAQGQGVIGVSTHLSPNSFLVLGTGDTVNRFRERMGEITSKRLSLRVNDHRWPPLHTPIVWEKAIPNRASVMLHTIPGGLTKPSPDVLSMVTATTNYDEFNSRDIIARWIDHRQRLWDVVNELLVMGIETIFHFGPEPNIIPATFERLAANVETQTRGSRRMRAASAVARRPWLQNILPRRAALLRAPLVKHVIVENWLLDPATR
ncbi:MAG: hypothetical protein KDB23_09560 [Planctomycetales bacterium]|nr:hypothetical protein [Planctomycetales bacterium]